MIVDINLFQIYTIFDANKFQSEKQSKELPQFSFYQFLKNQSKD